MRIIAIDWSGARDNTQREKIWLAEVQNGELTRLENGRDRQEIAQHLIELAREHRKVVIGLDFAFSLPAWFLNNHTLLTAHDLWKLVERQGEDWLQDCPQPFWGKPRRKCPSNIDLFRQTELDMNRNGHRAKSAFQIGGAGAVGTGSLRGMPVLRRLHTAGFTIWPFDTSGWPLVIEIYARRLTGSVNKSRHEARVTYLRQHFSNLKKSLRKRAVSCEDAFDAAVSALVMGKEQDTFHALSQATHPLELLEGRIWENSP